MRKPDNFLAERFNQNRAHLRAVAYRMLGSTADADDAVQESWVRLQRTDTAAIDNLAAWLTTVVGRVCLDMLRTRTARNESPLEWHVPDPILEVATNNPEDSAVMADAVGVALMVVLDTLSPDERLCFVLHDVFGIPFEQIAPIVERTPVAARQLASRGRRRVQAEPHQASRSPRRQRELVAAFLSAARDGDFDRLVALLHPDVVLRADFGASPRSRLGKGAQEVAGGAVLFSKLNGPTTTFEPVTLDGQAGMLVYAAGRLVTVMAFGFNSDEKITTINILGDPERLATWP